jgi:hypothetical protein
MEDRPGHHVMSPRLKHQRTTDPVVITKEKFPFLRHRDIREKGRSPGNDAHRVAAGVGVNEKIVWRVIEARIYLYGEAIGRKRRKIDGWRHPRNKLRNKFAGGGSLGEPQGARGRTRR